jgi:hypothetical protein
MEKSMAPAPVQTSGMQDLRGFQTLLSEMGNHDHFLEIMTISWKS